MSAMPSRTRYRLLMLLILAGASQLLRPSNCLPTNGPLLRKDSRIAIVGAGPSGLHMAYLLSSVGFANILVMESSGRVGGRSVSVVDDLQPAVTHELGTCYLSSEYVDFHRMARRIGYQLDAELVPLPKAVVRTSDGGQLELNRFIVDRARQQDPGLGLDLSTDDVLRWIQLAAFKYLAARQEIFPPGQPDYLEFPMRRPPADAMSRLNCTMRQFLEERKLMSLEPLFLLGMTAMGYGSIEDTSALYGLMWMTPAYLGDLLKQRAETGLSMLRRGFQTFWDATQAYLVKHGVQFRFNSRVIRVTRSATDVSLEFDGASASDAETFDFLIWTPSVHKSAAAAFDALTPAEAAAFGGLSARKFRTRLVRLLNPPEPGLASDPVAYYLDALDGRPSLNRLLAVRNSAKALLLESSPAHSATLVAYYLSDYNGDGAGEPEGEKSSDERLLDAGVSLVNATFEYMPRYSVADMANGALWRLLDDVQGAKRTWFVGHSVVFDSVKSVMKYNKMLLLGAFPSLKETLGEI